MNKVVALINLHTSPELGLLTEKRPLASTTFLGRYAFIDIVLSNLTNSGIDDIAILVKERYRSIIKHIGNENTYLQNSKTGFLNFFINEKGSLNPTFNTDLNNIKENDYFLFDKHVEYVLIAPTEIIMTYDYKNLISEHIKSGKKISVLYGTGKNINGTYNGLSSIVVDPLNNIQKIDPIDKDSDEELNISLKSYIINKDFLKEILDKFSNISKIFNISDMVLYITKYFEKVNAVKFEGKFLYFNTFKKYYDYSFKVLDQGISLTDPLVPDWVIFTTTHNTRPVLFGPKSKVENSIVSNGCQIDGTVKRSILSRNVVVEEGATVEDSIIFTNCYVKAGVTLKNVVSDKHVKFVNKKEIAGTSSEPIYIPQGAKL